MSVFVDHAPLYWDNGYPAIPLLQEQKKPAIRGWQEMANRMPAPEERQAWCRDHPNGNIGLPLGPQSGLVAIDIDTDDPKVREIIDKVLPPPVWVRRGKKGEVRVYRFTGERTNRIKDANGNMLVEILSTGSQIVLPSSIHPDTRKPYTANYNLYDLDRDWIPALPPDIGTRFKDAFRAHGFETSSGAGHGGFTRMIPAGARDSKMVAMAGLFARDVIRGERTFLDAAREITVWVENFTEKVVGDDIDPAKAVAKLAEFIRKDVAGSKTTSLPIGWDDGLTDEMKAELGLVFDPEDVSWSARQIMDALIEDLSKNPDPASDNFATSVERALARVARNEKIKSIESNQILRLIQTESKNTLTITVLNRRLKELRQGDVEGTNHAEVANMVLVYLSQFGEIRYDDGKIWQYRGAYWEELHTDEIDKLIATDFGHFSCTSRQNNYKQVRMTIALFCKRKLKSPVVPPGLNFANGFLTEDLQLVPHHPDQGSTYVMPFCYRPELAGQMPMFNQMLHDFWGRDTDFSDKVAALQEAIGATLFGQGTTYTRAILFFGPAATGKSTTMDILRGLVPPESASAVSPDKWHKTFSPVEMAGNIVNFAGELPESGYISGKEFKQIVSGEAIQVERKGEQPFDIELQAMHFFASNFLPRTRDVSGGFSRRWLILQFRHPVPSADRDLKLAERIVAEEAEAIVAWAVEGYIRVRAQKDYTLPASHNALIDRMNSGNSSLYHYLSTSPTITVGRANTSGTISAKRLHKDYRYFCACEDIKYCLEMRRFLDQMDEFAGQFGFETFSDNGNPSYRHIELIPLGMMQFRTI